MVHRVGSKAGWLALFGFAFNVSLSLSYRDVM